MRAAYLFEAKGIQRYIFDSGRLRDVIGASEIVACLARNGENDLLQYVLTAENLAAPQVIFSRRASAAFMAHGDPDSIRRLRRLWRLVVQLAAPGLEFIDALVEGDANQPGETPPQIDLRLKEECRKKGAAVRENGVASLMPLANPFCSFVPRTGRAQIGERRLGDGSLDPIDAIIAAQDAAYRSLPRDEGVAARFLDDAARAEKPHYRFPRNLGDSDMEPDTPDNPAFPFLGAQWVALVHADISGLGQIWIDLAKAATGATDIPDLTRFCDISRKIETAIAAAARTATREVLLPAAVGKCYGNTAKTEIWKIPARPLVLGGDDLTIIVRADLALNFTRRLLEEIETETKRQFDGLRSDPAFEAFAAKLRDRLSACAGIAYAKASQPFVMAYALADKLCAYAKKAAKQGGVPFPSALTFHVIQTSVQEDYEDEIVPLEMTDQQDRLLTLQPLFLGNLARQQNLAPMLNALDALIAALTTNERGLGKLKSMRAELFVGSQTAARLWTRWREVFAKGSAGQTGNIEAVDRALKALGVTDCKQLPFDLNSAPRTPIFDALQLMELGHVALPAPKGSAQQNSEAV